MSDLIDLRRELSELTPGFGQKSEQEQTQLLIGKARTDPDLMEAWENRYSDARTWANAKDKLAAWIDTVSPYFDADATADRHAIAFAVRAHGGQRPARQEPSYGNMDDIQFSQMMAEDFGIER